MPSGVAGWYWPSGGQFWPAACYFWQPWYLTIISARCCYYVMLNWNPRKYVFLCRSNIEWIKSQFFTLVWVVEYLCSQVIGKMTILLFFSFCNIRLRLLVKFRNHSWLMSELPIRSSLKFWASLVADYLLSWSIVLLAAFLKWALMLQWGFTLEFVDLFVKVSVK